MIEFKLLCKQKPYILWSDNAISAVNELFFMAIIVTLMIIHELQDSFIGTRVLPWLAIALVGIINIINITVVPILLAKH